MPAARAIGLVESLGDLVAWRWRSGAAPRFPIARIQLRLLPLFIFRIGPAGKSGDRWRSVSLIHEPHYAGIACIIAAEFGRTVTQYLLAHEVEQRLRTLHEIVALAHHEVETLPG